MKKILSSLIVVVTPFLLFAQPEKEIKPEIKHVTVFPDRAQIDHENQISLAPGKTTLRFTGLSPYIDQQSVQAKGRRCCSRNSRVGRCRCCAARKD
jgi:hypothetical protein